MALGEAKAAWRHVLGGVRHDRYANWAFMDQVMVSGVNFVTGLLVARFLGIEEFGRFTLAWMVVLLIGTLQHAALTAPMMSIGPREPPANLPCYYGAMLAQQAIFGAVSFAVLFAGASAAAAAFPNLGVGPLALPLAAATLAYQCQDFIRRYFFARERPALAWANDVVSYGGQLAALIWLFWHIGGAPNAGQVLWVIAATSAAAILQGLFCVRPVDWSQATFTAVFVRHGNFAKWLAASVLLGWIRDNLLLIMAGAALGPAAVGGIRAARNLMGITHVVLQAMENVLPLRAAQHFARGGMAELDRYFRRTAWFGGLATAAVALAIGLPADMLLVVVFGETFSDFGYVVRLWGVTYILIFLGVALSSCLRACDRTASMFGVQVYSTIVALIVCFPSAALGGVAGVMLGILVVHATALVLGWQRFRRFVVVSGAADSFRRLPPG